LPWRRFDAPRANEAASFFSGMPPVLTETKTWKKYRPPNETRKSSDLTPEEQARVRKILQVLRRRFGSWPQVAEALKVNLKTLTKVAGKSGKPSAGIALRAARAMNAPLEDLLSGAWPTPGTCIFCGRGEGKALTVR
jgi:hypothetical protein